MTLDCVVTSIGNLGEKCKEWIAFKSDNQIFYHSSGLSYEPITVVIYTLNAQTNVHYYEIQIYLNICP